MKTKEELNALKEEVETVSRKLHELTEDELKQVTMSEEKKTVELKNEDLEKVAGGFRRELLPEAETHSFNCGDTFKFGDYLHDIYIYLGQNGSYDMHEDIPLTIYNIDTHRKGHIHIRVWDLVSNYTYLGIHTEAELDAFCRIL